MLIYLFTLHFIADFLMQDREMGRKKSSEPKWLRKHIWRQWYVFFLGLALYDPGLAVVYATLNAALHAVIDWNIWKLYALSVWKRRRAWLRKRALDKAYEGQLKTVGDLMPDLLSDDKIKKLMKVEWKYWEDHLFYTTIGFDQLLHATTIIGLWWWLS